MTDQIIGKSALKRGHLIKRERRSKSRYRGISAIVNGRLALTKKQCSWRDGRNKNKIYSTAFDSFLPFSFFRSSKRVDGSCMAQGLSNHSITFKNVQL